VSGMLIPLQKCPRCGKYGVLYGHHFNGENDKYGWLGIKCRKCGYKEIDKEETARLREDFQKLECARRKLLSRKT